MNPQTLATVGSALYGALWQTKLANELGVNERTVRRWVAGEFTIPNGIRFELAKLCETKSDKLKSMAQSLISDL